MDTDALMATTQPPVMDIYAFASALGVHPEETAAPMASSCDGLLRTRKELVDLPLELIKLIIAAIVKDRDAVSLERLGGACRMLQALSRDVAAWHSLLLAHFDGELPPALRLAPSASGSAAPASGLSLEKGTPAAAAADCFDPRAALQETMRFARALIRRQREKRGLQLPLGKDFDAWHASAQYRAWKTKTDAGARRRMMQPSPERTIVSYGKFVRVTELSIVAKDSDANLTLEEATISTWLEYVTAEGLKDDGKNAVLANWLDAKVTGLASRPILDLEADVRELVAKHGLEGQAEAVGRMLAAARGEEYEELDDSDDGSWCLTPKRTECPIASTKVLAGLYGGLFSYGGWTDRDGQHADCMCLADGQRKSWRSNIFSGATCF